MNFSRIFSDGTITSSTWHYLYGRHGGSRVVSPLVGTVSSTYARNVVDIQLDLKKPGPASHQENMLMRYAAIFRTVKIEEKKKKTVEKKWT